MAIMTPIFVNTLIERKPAPNIVSLPIIRPVKNRKQTKVLLILNDENEKDPIYRKSNRSYVEAT